MRRAIRYDCRKPISRKEWLAKCAELRQQDYPRRRPPAQTVESSSRGKSQLFRKVAR